MARIDDLTKYVALRVDEYLETEAEAASSDIPFGDISFELEEAVKYLLRTMRRDLVLNLAKQPDIGPTLSTGAIGNVYIPLPDDYLRFVSVKLNGWMINVARLHPENSVYHRMQVKERLRATADRPKGFLISDPDAAAGMALEVFPAGAGTLDRLLYVPSLAPADMPTDYDDALVWKAAASILTIMGYQGLAGDAISQMQAAINQIQTGTIRVGSDGQN